MTQFGQDPGRSQQASTFQSLHRLLHARLEQRDTFMNLFKLIPLLLVATPSLFAQDNVQRTREEIHQLHQNTAAYINILEDPKRDTYQKPQQVIKALNLKPGEVIADIGAGSGYFTFHLSHRIGEAGKVYAVDVNPEMIIFINRRIRDSATRNVVTLLAPPDDPLLMDGSIDRFFICDTWHHVEKQEHYLALIKKALKPEGQVVMIDFQKRELPVGPPVDMKISREDLIRQMEKTGFVLAQEYSFLPYQYFLIFKAK